MIKEYSAWYQALQAGKIIKNAVQIKNVQTFSNGMAGLITAGLTISQAFGYTIPMSNDTIMQVAGGFGSLFMFVNIVWTAVTSEKVGYTSKK